jgi:hypothetical protein
MKNARVAILLRLLKTAAWAPIAVVVIHAVVIRSPWHDELNHFVHFLGGAAIVYFLLRAIEIAAESLSRPLPIGLKHAGAFAGACTAALFWEIGEFASDRLLHTRVQENVIETMLDLIAGASGAGCVLLAIVVVNAIARRKNGS